MPVAKRFEELFVWQRTYELSVDVHRATEGGAVTKDFDFRDQIRDASDSAQRNVAEGFGRFNPGEFANFLNMARGSAQETRALLRRGREVGCFSAEQFLHMESLATRGLQMLAPLQRYLRLEQARLNASRRYATP